MAESMKGLHRTCRCAELTEEYVGKTVTVMGWVAKQRNKGGIVFVDLRDRSGLIQLIYEEADCGEENFHKAEKMRAEFVVAATGTVTLRSGAGLFTEVQGRRGKGLGAVPARADALSFSDDGAERSYRQNRALPPHRSAA